MSLKCTVHQMWNGGNEIVEEVTNIFSEQERFFEAYDAHIRITQPTVQKLFAGAGDMYSTMVRGKEVGVEMLSRETCCEVFIRLQRAVETVLIKEGKLCLIHKPEGRTYKEANEELNNKSFLQNWEV